MSRFGKPAGVAAIVALLAAAAVYVLSAGGPDVRDDGVLDFGARDSLLYVENGHVAQLSRTDAAARVSPHECLRVYAAAGTVVCLRAVAVPPSFEAVVSGDDFVPTRSIKLDGTPSRARVSPSGNLVAWTVFRDGDSYLPTGHFSTTAGIYDRRSGTLYGSLEDFTSIVDGVEHRERDRNFWGVTFAGDDRTFYATLSSGGRTWLMRGDLTTRTMTSLRENVECPSLSPDGGRIAYKKRDGQVWRLHVLDLASGQDTRLAETEPVDDQAAWLDDRTVAYGRPPAAGEKVALFAVPADGSGSPALLRRDATSPSAVAGR